MASTVKKKNPTWTALTVVLATVLFLGEVRAEERAPTFDPLPSLGGNEEEQSLDTFIGPRMKQSLRPSGRAPLSSKRSTPIPGPDLPPADIDPGRIPPVRPRPGEQMLRLTEDPRIQRPRPAPRPRAEDPVVRKLFPSLRYANYVGDAACFQCHRDKKDDWRRSVYGLVHYDSSIPAERRGCEGCHGPGSEHGRGGANGIVNPANLERRQINRLCLSCHAEERLIQRQSWHFTNHNESEVTCISCHSIHRPKADKALSDEPNRLCFQCHRDQSAYFFMTSHHPVKIERADGSLRDGKVRCIDCHQAYSARSQRNLRAGNVDTCVSCHPQHRGPFLFQHGGGSSSLADGCSTCHVAHGAPNRSLLNRPDRVLCLTCHTDRMDHFPAPSCVSTQGCHSDIHGSNMNRLFIRGIGINRSNVLTPANLLGVGEP